jgi:hypothetical protein
MQDMTGNWKYFFALLDNGYTCSDKCVIGAIHDIWSVHSELEEAQMPGDLATARAALRDMRGEVTGLKAANLELSEARSGEQARIQELQNINKQLNAELALETTRANEFAAEAGILAQRVKDYEAGHAEVREIFAEVRPPAAVLGIKRLVSWAVEEITTLRTTNPSAAPLDDWTLEYLRRWWKCTTDEQHRIDAFIVLANAITRRDQRGRVWDMVVMMVNKRIAPCQITAPVVIEFPVDGQAEETPAG